MIQAFQIHIDFVRGVPARVLMLVLAATAIAILGGALLLLENALAERQEVAAQVAALAAPSQDVAAPAQASAVEPGEEAVRDVVAVLQRPWNDDLRTLDSIPSDTVTLVAWSATGPNAEAQIVLRGPDPESIIKAVRVMNENSSGRRWYVSDLRKQEAPDGMPFTAAVRSSARR